MPAAEKPRLEALRHADQLAFMASAAELELGDLAATPFSREQLRSLGPAQAAQWIDSGLSAEVFRLQAGGRQWTLKRARPEARVRNIDGQTAFLNEIQRRIDHQALKRQDPARWTGLVDTAWGSWREGLLLSPWIDGEAISEWDERKLGQLLELVCALWLEGLFEWDLCAGNLLDEGGQVRLFDFGYQYRFDPRTQFSSAGRGDDEPLFHPAERFESRCLCAQLLMLEQGAGQDAALALFRREKAVALEAYRRLREAAARRGSQPHVLAWLDGFIHAWREALRGDAAALYLKENWRSHVLDLDDDLRGRSCTPMTLRRADWLLDALHRHGDALQAQQAFFWADRGLDLAALRARYSRLRREAESFQLERPASCA